MKVYHYTTIDSLELILKNKTIKFNRLDKVDDLSEASMGAGLLNTQLGKYVFVSCWTDNGIESIPMWDMYSKNFSGVRIELEKNMFNQYNYRVNTKLIEGEIVTILSSINDAIGEDYLVITGVIPISYTYTKIVYTEYAYKFVKDAIVNKNRELFKYPEIGKYKRPEWEFQSEVRYRIFTIPYDKKLLGTGNGEDIILKTIHENKPISRECFYVLLNTQIFNNMKILLGPSISKEDIDKVYFLVSKYCPNAIIEKSKLTGTISK